MSINLVRVRQILEECVSILVRKNEDYGDQNIRETGIQGIAVRLVDKARRLHNLTHNENGNGPLFESVADTLTDITNYGIIGRMLIEGTWGKEPKHRMVYLAGPIDRAAPGGDVTRYREYATKKLAFYGVGVFDPSRAYNLATGDLAGAFEAQAGAIEAINRAAIRSCDAVLAFVDDTPSVGTSREIEYAKSIRRPVVAVNATGRALVSLQDVDTCPDEIEAVFRLLDRYLLGGAPVATPTGAGINPRNG